MWVRPRSRTCESGPASDAPQASMPAPMSRVLAGPLSVVIVTYNSAAAVRATLAALGPQLRAGDELVVVDNGSADDTLAAVRQLAPDAVVIEPGGNAGFAAGVNAG